MISIFVIVFVVVVVVFLRASAVFFIFVAPFTTQLFK
jgi:hypothetical protein